NATLDQYNTSPQLQYKRRINSIPDHNDEHDKNNSITVLGTYGSNVDLAIINNGSTVATSTIRNSHNQKEEEYHDDENEPIKQYSSEQRLIIPNSEEPSCIICGKYGEYINDDTDNDICSRECKAIDTDMNASSYVSLQKQQQDHHVLTVHQSSSIAQNVHAKLTNYQESSSVTNMPEDQIKLMLQAHEINVKGKNIPRPIVSFDQCHQVFGQQLLDNLDRQGWSMATSVQRQAVPVMLAGRDVTVISPARSGKTGAFVLPILAHCQSLSVMYRHKRRSGPYAIILSPTRTLCVQIEATIKRLAKGIQNIRTALLVGGEPWHDQLHRLRKGVQIVIGTPGRVSDMSIHHPHMLRIWRTRILILDEADILFASAMKKQVRAILNKLPDKLVRQYGYFSTGISPDQAKILHRMTNPIEIRVGEPNEKEEKRAVQQLGSVANVKQTLLWVENPSKTKRLLSILDDPKYFSAPVLVFTESNLTVLKLTQTIQKKKKYNHWRIVAMDSEKSLKERTAILEGMNSNPPKWDVVISTDVLARGIDLPSVNLVINYDMANTIPDYIHRINRAMISESANQGVTVKRKRGWAITFINKDHKNLFGQLYQGLSNKSPVDVTPLPSEIKQDCL
ncbi:hypothetical protein INT45_008034, partial [Circinella minor]